MCPWKTLRKVSIVTEESVNTENVSTSPSDIKCVSKPLGYGVFVRWKPNFLFSFWSSTYLNLFCSPCLHLCSSLALPWTWQDCGDRLCRGPREKVTKKFNDSHTQQKCLHCHSWKSTEITQQHERSISTQRKEQNRPYMWIRKPLNKSRMNQTIQICPQQHEKAICKKTCSLYPHFMLLCWHLPRIFPTALSIL